MKRIFTLFLSFALPTFLLGQVSFTNRNDLLLNTDNHSGVAIAIADMNGDFLDDIVHLRQGRELNIQYQVPNQAFSPMTYGDISNGSQWSMCVADVDNNGYNDVLAGGYYDGVKVIQADGSGQNFTMNVMPGDFIFIQGSNFADINNDGFIDAFTCHDDAESRIYGNNGDGTYFEADAWIDMATVPASDNSGNYGSVWSDFDNDGDLDLYIAKCRQGVNNPADPRRINALYVNDGNNNYTEAAESYGLKIGAQSWTADFADIDNDGDMDCFITNHDVPSQLLEQDENGYFNDITASSGLDVGGLPIQGVMRDFNNDGFVDILVAGTQHYLYLNNGDKTFTEVETIFDQNDIESYAIGDLNHDGALDIYAGYAEIYTSPSDIEDVIWMNDNLDADHNFVTFNLVGTVSNRNAIGARVEIYGNWGVQVREVRAGESYGIMNSFQVHFGLGTAPVIDEVVIHWPSGITQTLENVNPNQFITIVEEECVSPPSMVTINGPTTFCSGESTELSAPAGYTYLWSNGETTQTITVTEGGQYNVLVSDGSECTATSTTIQITVDPIEQPTIEVLGPTTFCNGGAVQLIASDAQGFSWSNGATTQTILAEESGLYSVTTQGLCDEFDSEAVEVTVLIPEMPVAEDVLLTAPGQATLEASGEDLYWYDVPFGGSPIAVGPTFVTPFLDLTTTYFVENKTLFAGLEYAGGPAEHQGSSFFNGPNFSGSVIFDVYETMILKSITVYTDTEGERTFEVRTEDDQVLASFTYLTGVGQTIVPVEFQLEPGTNYRLITNSDQNIAALGTASPRFYRSNEGVSYPYALGDLGALTNSNAGLDWFYYFYDWQVETPSFNCTSDRVPVEVEVLPTGTKEVLQPAAFAVQPNPNQGVFEVVLQRATQGNSTLQLLDLQGRTLWQKNLSPVAQQERIQTMPLAKGTYLLQWVLEEGVEVQRVVVQ